MKLDEIKKHVAEDATANCFAKMEATQCQRERQWLVVELESERAKVAKLREALTWYADHETHMLRMPWVRAEHVLSETAP